MSSHFQPVIAILSACIGHDGIELMAAYDVIVLGMGVMGSAAAYHLARAGQRVLALEQFEVDHTNGSSVDASRIFRHAYDHPAYVALARAAYPLWHALEDETGAHLMRYTGALDWGRPDVKTLAAFKETVELTGIEHEWLTPEEVTKRFPQYRLDDDMMAIYHADAGYLVASRCVMMLAQEAQKHGALIQTNARVQEVIAHSDSVTVRTASESYSAARLIITAGSWSSQLLSQLGLNLPLTPTRQQVIYFETQDPALFEPDRFPVYIAHGEPWYYGLPSVEGSGMKTAIHNLTEATDPDHMDHTVSPQAVEHARGFLRRYIPLADSKPRWTRTCLYTMTPDEHFIIDRHPAYPHIAIGAGFSGHGFKFGILTGQILMDLVLRGTTPHDISLFNIARFG